MTNFLLTLIVVLIVGNQSWRLIKQEGERPKDMNAEIFVAYIIAFVLILGLATAVSLGLLMLKSYLLHPN